MRAGGQSEDRARTERHSEETVRTDGQSEDRLRTE